MKKLPSNLNYELEARLTQEMEEKLDMDPMHSRMALLTQRILYRQIMALHNELQRIKDEQIKCLRAQLRSYGGD
jgi:hypothetical protein